MPDTLELAELRRRALDPEIVRLHPALMADAFLTLAEARGIRTRPENIGAAHHRIGQATEPAPDAGMITDAEDFTAIMAGAMPRISAYVRARLSRADGGDAA